MKIGAKLLIISALILAIPLAGVTYVAVQKGSAAVATVGESGLVSGAQFVASDIDHALHEEELITQALAENTSVVTAVEAVESRGVKAAAPEIRAATAAMVQFDTDKSLNHILGGLMATDNKGIVVVASRDDDPGRDPRSRRRSCSWTLSERWPT